VDKSGKEVKERVSPNLFFAKMDLIVKKYSTPVNNVKPLNDDFSTWWVRVRHEALLNNVVNDAKDTPGQ